MKAKPWVGRVGDSIDTAIGTLTGKLPMKRFGKQAVGDVPNCLHWAALLSASLKDEEENGQEQIFERHDVASDVAGSRLHRSACNPMINFISRQENLLPAINSIMRNCAPVSFLYYIYCELCDDEGCFVKTLVSSLQYLESNLRRKSHH